MMDLSVPIEGNKKLEKIIEELENDEELEGFLESANVNAVKRLKYSDHGTTHNKIVANAALKISQILYNSGITPSIVKDHEMEREDSEVVIFLASIFHDIGMIAHRKEHDLMGINFTFNLLERLLDNIYEGKKKSIIISEVLTAIYPHDNRGKPLTVEGGIVSIADALDMAEGRARIPFEEGKQDIHSVSAMSISEVNIEEGKEDRKPVKIKITMKNSAGIFQVDELLKKKLKDSGLKDKFDIVAEIEGDEENIVKRFEI